MAQAKKIAVLAINYNGQKYLKDFFESLAKCDDSEIIDAFLVDNNSSDDSIEYTNKHFPQVHTINTGSNAGFSGAYNYAHQELRNSNQKYDYYFIVNNDCEFSSKDIFSRAMKLFAADETIGIVAPTIIDSSNKTQIAAGDYIFVTGTTLGFESGKDYKPSNRLLLSKWASGCAFFIKSDLFEKLKGFEDYFMYMEDVCLSWKVLNTSHKIVSDGGSSIIHLGGGTEKSSTFEHYYAERNRVLMYWQNLSFLSFVILLPLFLFLRILLLFKQGSLKVARVKFKALLTGLILIPKYPKRNTSFAKDRVVIKLLTSPIKEYENPLSNS